MDSLNTTETETDIEPGPGPGPSKKMKSNTDDSLFEDADDDLPVPVPNGTLGSLGNILEAGKGHLIRNFTYKYVNTPNALLIPKFLETHPKITSAIVDMVSGTRWSDALALNAFIESLQDTVENLELYFSYNNSLSFRDSRLQIPPMKNLKSITLKGQFKAVGYTTKKPLRTIFFKFQDKISADNYFPSLLKVRLNLQGGHLIEDNLMSFFKFDLPDQNQNDTTNCCEWKWNHLPKVDIFEIDKDTFANNLCLEKRKPLLTIKNFPNVRVLKIKGGEVKDLASSWWALSQKVEFMEIYALSPSEISDADCNDVDASLLVDKFFTGFSLGMCRKLRTTELMQEMNNQEMLKFLRLTPSVCDLQYLRELTLQFSGEKNWSTEFASHVTVTYAFAKMPNTKFIVSYDPKIFDADTRYTVSGQVDAERTNNFEELCIGFMKPYVQIVHENNN